MCSYKVLNPETNVVSRLTGEELKEWAEELIDYQDDLTITQAVKMLEERDFDVELVWTW